MDEELRMLEYAGPEKRGRVNPLVFPSAPFFMVMGLLAAGLAVTDVKFSPGGPFVSVHAEVVPAVVWVWMVGTGRWTWRRRTGAERGVMVMAWVIASLGVVVAVGMCVGFWMEPRARGVLIGW